MKISVPSFLGAIGAYTAGKREGQMQRQQEALAQQDQNFRLALSLIPQLGQQFQDQQAQELASIDSLLKNPNLAPESLNALSQQRASIAQRHAATPNPYGAEAYQRVLEQSPRTRGIAPLFQGRMQAPAPTAAPALPSLKFRDPRSEEALGGIRANIQSSLNDARTQGDPEAIAKLRRLQTDIDLQRVTPDAAGPAYDAIVQGMQARGSASDIGRRVKDAQKELESGVRQGNFLPEDLPKVKELRRKLGRVNVSTAEGLKAAAQILQEFDAEYGTLDIQPGYPERLARERLDAEGTYKNETSLQSLRNTDQQHRQRIAAAKTPPAKLRAIKDHDAFVRKLGPRAAEAGVELYGEGEFDTTPGAIPTTETRSPLGGSVSGAERIGRYFRGGAFPPTTEVATTRPETREEVDARLLQKAAEELPPGSDEQKKLLNGAYGKFFDLIKSPAFARLPPDAQQKIIGNVNSLGDQLGFPDVPAEFKPGLSPELEERIRQNRFENEQKLRKVRFDEKRRLNEEQLKRDREDRLSQMEETVAKLPPGRAMKAQKAKEDAGRVHAELIAQQKRVQEAKATLEAAKGNKVALKAAQDALAVEEKRRDDIAADWKQKDTEFNRLAQDAPVAKPGAKIGAGARRTISFEGASANVTFEELKKAAKARGWSDAKIEKTWKLGK